MATIAQNQEDEENKQNPAGGPITVGNTGGAGGASKTALAPGQSPVQQTPAPQTNAGYTDVASYLNANQNQQGASQLGQQVSQNLTNKFNTTKSGIDSSAQQFQGQVNQGYVPQNTDLIKQVAANPTAAAGNADQTKAFQAQLNDTYTGPTSWADQGTQQGKVNDANQYASLATTPGGLNVYSQEVEGQNGGPQSQGINQLDTLLLGGNPGAVSQVRAAADPYKTLNDYINSQNTAGLDAVKTAQTGAQNASQAALDAFTGANGTLTNLNATVNKTAADRLAAAKEQNATLNKDISNLYGGQAVDNTSSSITGYGGSQNPWYNTTNYTAGSLSPQDMQALGITQEQADQLHAAMQEAGTSVQGVGGHNFAAMSPTAQIDISQWLNQQDPSQAINPGTVATPEQYAQMSAIQQLLGGKTPQGNAINPALSSLAGTAPTNFNQFDFADALKSAQATAAAERDAANKETQGLTSAADKAHADSQHGGFLNSVKNAVTHPGNLIGTIANPTSWIPNIINAAQGKTIDPEDVGAGRVK